MNEGKLPTAEQIELRAYELYLERGCEDGSDLVDWLAAERELIELSGASASGAPREQAATAGLQTRSPRRAVKKVVGARATGYRTRKQAVLQPK
jgi:hypothetical protein